MSAAATPGEVAAGELDDSTDIVQVASDTDERIAPAAYYAVRPLDRDPAERAYLAGRCHYLRHERGHDVEDIASVLALDDGAAGSLGRVRELLDRWRCDRCWDDPYGGGP